MTALAYLITTRRDLGHIFPYLFDLRPDGLYRSPTVTPPGQTRHLPEPPVAAGTPLLTYAMDGSATATVDLRGLSAWAIDNIQNRDGGKSLALTDAQAAYFEVAILKRVEAAQSLTVADVDAVLNKVPGVTGSSAFPSATSKSTGSIDGLLRVISDHTYLVPAGAKVIEMNGAFPVDTVTMNHSPLGYFLNGRAAPVAPSRFGLPPKPARPPLTVGAPPAEQVPLLDCAELRQSIRKGWLSHLVDPRFRWHRGTLTYGPSGTATTIGGTSIPGPEAGQAAYRARAAVVYDATGAVIA